jgi:uncharacterized protein (DUF1684 family)
METHDLLDLVDYRGRVAELYAEVRRTGTSPEAWQAWCEGRDRLFREHPCSPYPPDRRPDALRYFPYDSRLRTLGELRPTGDEVAEVGHSAAGGTRARRAAEVSFVLAGRDHTLSVFWLEQYGGGLFLPFRDATAGTETYGGGRYLLDSAKGADLGRDGGRLVLDFNFAYHPSCFHDPQWSCPLAPPENRLDLAVTAGERA